MITEADLLFNMLEVFYARKLIVMSIGLQEGAILVNSRMQDRRSTVTKNYSLPKDCRYSTLQAQS